MTAWDEQENREVERVVDEILHGVKTRGDDALLEYTNRFDRRDCQSVERLMVPGEELQRALDELDGDMRGALETAAARIRDYHRHQLQQSWQYSEPDGTMLGQQITPLERVGIYVPGGKASYPSSVLMNAIPARIAGVEEIIMMVPAPDGELNPLILAAAEVCGIKDIYRVGGAQAIGSLAYGTETIKPVDIIVGPGNQWVAEAKKQVLGDVNIDMMAGPSEILIVADKNNNPDWIAVDLLSQAEHDKNAQSILITDDAKFAENVIECVESRSMERQAIIETSLSGRGALIQVKNMDDAIDVINYISPEHLELSVDDPMVMAKKVRHAGAIFMGRYTAEALGDYCAGPNHVLPTSATSRFSSPLGVYDFQKRSSLIYCSKQGASELGKIASTLARGESLSAHAQSAEYRIKD